MSHAKHQGLIPKIKQILYGAATPKLRRYTTITQSDTAADTALTPEGYRWFRRDELVRRCIVINASFATFAAGFDTELEPVDESLDENQKKADG